MPDQLPDPLVPAEVDLNGMGFMPLEVTRVMQSTMFGLSTGDEFKAGFALWCASWYEVPGGSLPSDEAMLEFLSRSKAWKKVRARALHGWIKCSDGRLYHRIVARLATSAWDRREEWREVQDNKDSRQKRWREKLKQLSKLLRDAGVTPPSGAKLPELQRLCRLHVDGYVDEPPSTGDGHVDGDGRLDETALTGRGTGTGTGKGEGQGQGEDGVGATPTKTSPKGPGAKAPSTARRGERIGEDWVLPKAWGEWALREYPHWTADTVRRIAKGFHNHWKAKTGKDATKLDWKATWENWCSSAITQRDYPPPKDPGTAARDAEAKRLLGFPAAAMQEVIDV